MEEGRRRKEDNVKIRLKIYNLERHHLFPWDVSAAA
jgi:hypothetical protein